MFSWLDQTTIDRYLSALNTLTLKCQLYMHLYLEFPMGKRAGKENTSHIESRVYYYPFDYKQGRFDLIGAGIR